MKVTLLARNFNLQILRALSRRGPLKTEMYVSKYGYGARNPGQFKLQNSPDV